MAQSTCGSAPARSAPCPVSPRRSAAWRAATAHLPVALVLVGAGSLALAATPIPTTATINVTANVVNGCQVYLAPNQKTGIPFGVLDFGTQPPTRTGTVSVMAAGGVFKSDAVRHPLQPLHPQTRQGLLELAAEADVLALRWGR